MISAVIVHMLQELEKEKQMNRKEYTDRWKAPLVNPPVTYGEYEKNRNEVTQCNECGTILCKEYKETLCIQCYADLEWTR